jgi:uncharacterized oxidoreductase
MSAWLTYHRILMKTQGNTIVITGGSSGIGRSLALRFHEAGNQVIVTGRRAAALSELTAAAPGIASYLLDIRDASEIQDFARRVVTDHPDLNVLVNNAGIMRLEDASAERDLGDAEETVLTNLLGPIRLTNALIGHLLVKADTAIVNVSSGLAFVPLAAAPTYSATKAAIHSYSVSLRVKLKGKVEVIELAPPGVRTEQTPGQSTREHFMALEQYVDETMALLQKQPTPGEVLVERVKFQRLAETEGRFDKALAALNGLTHLQELT